MSDVLPDGMDDALADFDAERLYRVEEYTDFVAGTIKVFTPVSLSGVVDATRNVKFVSSVNCAFKGVPMTVPFEIEAACLPEAVKSWKAAALVAARAKLAELEKQMFDRSILSPAGGFHAPLQSRGKPN